MNLTQPPQQQQQHIQQPQLPLQNLKHPPQHQFKQQPYTPQHNPATLATSSMNRFIPLKCTTNSNVAPPDFVNNLRPGPRPYNEVVQKGPETIIFSTSITKGINRNDLSERYEGEGQLSFRRFPGAKASHIKDYMPTHLAEIKPETVIIQAGGNDLPTPRSNPVPVEEISKVIMECGLLSRSYGVKNVLVSGVLPRKQYYTHSRCKELNKILQEQCRANGFVYIDNSNIDVSHLYDGVHLNQEGSVLLRDSYLLELNGLYWDDVILKSNR